MLARLIERDLTVGASLDVGGVHAKNVGVAFDLRVDAFDVGAASMPLSTIAADYRLNHPRWPRSG